MTLLPGWKQPIPETMIDPGSVAACGRGGGAGSGGGLQPGGVQMPSGITVMAGHSCHVLPPEPVGRSCRLPSCPRWACG